MDIVIARPPDGFENLISGRAQFEVSISKDTLDGGERRRRWGTRKCLQTHQARGYQLVQVYTFVRYIFGDFSKTDAVLVV